MPAITALLPAYNERPRGSVVLRTRAYADRVVVIDDGSSDHTSEVASFAGAEVLRHVKNQGKGAALKTGFASLNGDAVIVTIDTDGQHDPSDPIPRLVEPILRGDEDTGSAAATSTATRRTRLSTAAWGRGCLIPPPVLPLSPIIQQENYLTSRPF